MKDLIISSAMGYRPKDVACWINSIKMSGFSGDVIVLDFGLPEETQKFLIGKGVKLYKCDLNGRHIVVERFIAMYTLIDTFDKDKYRAVISTDIKDVIFQQNPSLWLDILMRSPIIAASESIMYKDEDWGNNNLKVSYPHLYEKFKKNIIYNAGTISGTLEFFKDLCIHIYHLSLLGQDSQPDQAAFNILINSQPFKSQVFFVGENWGWVCNLGTTLADKVKEKYKGKLSAPLPIFNKNGEVFNTQARIFYIVHQYDRVSGLKDLIIHKFGQV